MKGERSLPKAGLQQLGLGWAQPGLCGQPPPPGSWGVGRCLGPPSSLVGVCGDSPLVPRNAVIFGPDIIKVVPTFPANQQLRNTAPRPVKACENQGQSHGSLQTQGWLAPKARGSPTVLCPCKACCPHLGPSSPPGAPSGQPRLRKTSAPQTRRRAGAPLAPLRRSSVRDWPAWLTAPGGSRQGVRRPLPGGSGAGRSRGSGSRRGRCCNLRAPGGRLPSARALSSGAAR